MAKATAHRCKRDMAWSWDAGRERTKAWMQASDEGNGLLRTQPTIRRLSTETVMQTVLVNPKEYELQRQIR